MDEQDKDEWHVRVLHAIESIPKQLSNISSAVTVLGFVLFVIAALYGRLNCTRGTRISESQCEKDCAVRATLPEHSKETPRYNHDECWCFDSKFGQSTRLW